MMPEVNFTEGSVSDTDWDMSGAKWERSGVPATESNKGENRWEQ
jgi:hypothetical protein